MSFVLNRLFPAKPIEPIPAGLYAYQVMLSESLSMRLHLRIEPDGAGLMIVNASTVLHLNKTAAAHAYRYVLGESERDAARFVQKRYRVSWRRALHDQQALRQQLQTVVTTPDLDPVLFLGMTREEPGATSPSAPYRLDLALTYALDPDGRPDPLASRRAARELSTDEWKRILEVARNAGIPHVTFTGGEPCRRKDLAELILHAEHLGLVAGVLTAGSRLAEPAYLDSLANAGVDHFLVTWVPTQTDSTQGLRNASASDVFTTAHLTLGWKDSKDLPAWVETLKQMRVNAVSLSSRAGEDAQAILPEARERVAAAGLNLVWDLPVPYSEWNPIAVELEHPSNLAGCQWLYVEPDGDVLLHQGAEAGLGNLLADPWATIWSRALQQAS
jgi:hypothetical protein